MTRPSCTPRKMQPQTQGGSDSDSEYAPTAASEAPVHLKWPWGEHGRPSDRATSRGGKSTSHTEPKPSPSGGHSTTWAHVASGAASAKAHEAHAGGQTMSVQKQCK